MKSCGIDGSVCPRRFPFTLGTDPEFGIEGGTSAHDAAYNTQTWDRDKEFLCGFDGMQGIFEIRPQAAYCAHALLDNTRMAFLAQREYFKRSRRKFVAEAMIGNRFPAGGHLHFGIANTRENNVAHLVQALDAVLLPAVQAIFSREHWRARRRAGYGEAGDFRTEHRHGFEYRPLPTFLAERGLTLAVYALGGAVVEQVRAMPEWDFEWQYKLSDIKELPVIRKHWREISYLAWLAKMGYKVREDNDLINVWKIA